MGSYILQVIVFQLVFLLVYEFLLKKETFFSYNRVYLLLTPVLALVLPFLKIELLQNSIPSQVLVELPEVLVTTGKAPEISENAASLDLWSLIYAGGAMISLILLLNKFRLLWLLSKKGERKRKNGIDIVKVPGSTVAFSFNQTVFIGEHLERHEREQIVSHEMVHVRERHSFDLLFFEVLKVFLWFNPLIYIFQTRISALHEFQADARVVKTGEKQRYFQQLLNSAFESRDISFVNQFYTESLIKKRIIMLQRTKSKSVSKIKYLLVIPLMLLMLLYVSGTAAQAQEPKVSVVKTEVSKDSVLTVVPFAVVEEVPVYPGCEDLETNEEKKECMSNKITNFVNTNFNTGLGKELGLTGLNRIYVQFKISSSGEVTEVKSRASNEALGKEAERVVAALPMMQPGKQKGREVAVMYSLPINFMVPEEKEDKKADE